MKQKMLYHYTSIKNLAHILSSRKIRFNRLDRVDDMFDGLSKDINNISDYYYVSCWTEYEKESIPFWNMYTPEMKGVRIGLPLYPFLYYDSNGGKIIHTEGLKNQNLFPIKDLDKYRFTSDVVILFQPESDFLYKVEYVSKDEDAIPYYLSMNKGSTSVAINQIGKKKLDDWKFQNEWRYRIYFTPKFIFDKETKLGNNKELDQLRNRIENEKNDIDYFDMDLNEKAYKSMQIVIGPKADSSDKIIIDSLIEKYNTNAKVSESVLKGRIR